MGKDDRGDLYGPDGERRPESGMLAKRVSGGTEHYDDKQPFILSRCPYKPPKKRGKHPDVLVVRHDPIWSETRTEELGRPVYYFSVHNDTKGNDYTVEVFEGINGEPCAVDNCPAAVVCKHILACVVEVLKMNPQFGEAEKRSEFMTGVRLMGTGQNSDF
jgi:hypothetical protein